MFFVNNRLPHYKSSAFSAAPLQINIYDNNIQDIYCQLVVRYHRGEISKEEYDRWRYNYPKYDTAQNWARVPSKEFSDALAEAFKDKLETD